MRTADSLIEKLLAEHHIDIAGVTETIRQKISLEEQPNTGMHLLSTLRNSDCLTQQFRHKQTAY